MQRGERGAKQSKLKIDANQVKKIEQTDEITEMDDDMKKMRGRDSLFIAGVVVVVGVLALGAGRGKGKNVPADDRHKSVYDSLKNHRNRADIELLCCTCHGKSAIPLPKDHPPKEQCLICHLPVQA